MTNRVRDSAYVSAGSELEMGKPVTTDVPPFVKAFGNQVRALGLNDFTLRKRTESVELRQASNDAGDRFCFDFPSCQMNIEPSHILPELGS